MKVDEGYFCRRFFVYWVHCELESERLTFYKGLCGISVGGGGVLSQADSAHTLRKKKRGETGAADFKRNVSENRKEQPRNKKEAPCCERNH